ncbi:MAG: aryldialkylphosphatase [Verrucomicrobia bacterium]|nr:aryldialkylphosphatase [Verrucomicrobiota bacterium]
MIFVRTVRGDVAAAQLGACYAHEHLIIGPSFTTHVTPEFELSDVERAVVELNDFRAAGGRALVDSMPCDSGRDVLKLAELSRRADVHIVAPTGLHLAKYYDPGHWGSRYREEELAALFVADLLEGIDAHDYNGPLVHRTPHRAGVIKIATDRHFTAREERVLAAAAEAHRRTGAPILTHTEQGELGLEQVERLRALGVDLGHVCLSHLDRRPDPGYHREILASGVRVEYDSAFRWKPGQGNPTRDLVLALLGEFPDQIMLGMDAARRGYWRSHGGNPGLAFLLTDFSASLRAAGVTAEALHRIFVSTPAATFSFKTTPP